jgi:MFS transporter, Spinster family, sphingosine-1-phosphate transporter
MNDDDRAMSAKQFAFLCLLTLLNVLNFVDRQLLASFANFIVPDLGLTNTQFGLLTGLAFILFYATMGLFMGALADLVHRPRLIAAGLALWSLLTAASGAARSFAMLALPRMFIGVGESALTPTSMSLLSDRFPPSRLGFASGFYYMGVPIGVGVSLLIAGYLGPAIGWRGCFFVLGLIGLALSVVMLFVKETPRRHVSAAPAKAAARAAGPPATRAHGPRALIATLGRALASSPALTLTIAGGVAMHFVLGAATFDQLWYVHERGFERAEIARMTGWIGMVGGVLGNLFGGMVSDWWLRRTGTGRAVFLFWLILALAPFNIAYRMVSGDSPFFWIGVFTGYFGLGAFYGPTFSTVQELVPPQIRATIVAFYVLMLNLIGLVVGITAGGWMIDHLIATGAKEPYSVTLLSFQLISLTSAPLFLLAGRRFKSDRERLVEELAAA